MTGVRGKANVIREGRGMGRAKKRLGADQGVGVDSEDQLRFKLP